MTKFLEGAEPHAVTRRKLEEWLVGAAGATGVSPSAAYASIRLLVATLPPSERGRAGIALLDELKTLIEASDAPLPKWWKQVRARLASTSE